MDLVESVSELPTARRYITTHDAEGKSVFAETPALLYHPIGKIGGAARSWAAQSVPAQLGEDADLKAYYDEESITSYNKKAITIETGVNLVLVDFLPLVRSQMHQTVSLDFFVCVQGILELELDSGEKVTVRPGVSILPVLIFFYTANGRARTTLSKELRCIDGSILPRRTVLDWCLSPWVLHHLMLPASQCKKYSFLLQEQIPARRNSFGRMLSAAVLYHVLGSVQSMQQGVALVFINSAPILPVHL